MAEENVFYEESESFVSSSENLALMTLPVVPTRRDRICFFLRPLLKRKKCLIAKIFYPLPSPFSFQTLFAFLSAMTCKTSELLARS